MELKMVNDKGAAGTFKASDEVFARDFNEALVHQIVVAFQANARIGSRAQKDRGDVSHSTKKPWRQKGTGRARVGEIRNPLWRKGGTVFGPQPRSYEYALPRKVKLGALRAALSAKLADGTLTVVDKLDAGSEKKTKATAEMLKKLGASGKTLVIDVNHEDAFTLTARNIAGVTLKASNRVTARDVIDTDHVIATRGAIEKLQESLR
jgi:large subunit ribosomal protein L4